MSNEKEKVEQTAAEINRFAVFYVRLAHEPFPPCYGVGIHGYFASSEVPKRGYGIKRVILTREGYADGSELPQATIIKLVDSKKGFTGPQNETGLLLWGALACFDMFLVSEDRPTELTIILPTSQDVKYLLQIRKLAENGWKSRNGEELPFSDTLAQILARMDTMADRGNILRVITDPYQDGSLGRDHATVNAADGLTAACKGDTNLATTMGDATGYWNYNHGRSPWFNKSRLLTLTHHEPEGDRYWHLMDHESNKEDKEACIGQFLPMISMSVVKIKEPDPVIQEVIDEQNKFTPDGEKRVVLLMLDNLYRPSTHRALANGGVPYLRSKSVTVDLVDSRDNTVTQELYPPRQAMRAVEEGARNEQLLREALRCLDHPERRPAGVPATMAGVFQSTYFGPVFMTDVTDEFFWTTTNEKGKVACGITKHVEVPNTTVEVIGHTHNGDMEFTLSIGMDTPKRNALAAMAGEGIKAYLLTNPETELTVSYRLLVVKGEEAGIWVTPYANRLFVNKQ